MGYSTRYCLTILESKDNIDEMIEKYLEEIDIMYVFDDGLGNYGDGYKWYDHESDMRELSKEFPDVLFLLEGEGEENGDLWKKYYLNGLMQCCKAKITYDEYDENKLM